MGVPAKRTPPEKAAILLHLLGEEAAAKVLRNLPLKEAKKVARAISRMKPTSREEIQAIAGEFLQTLTQSGGLMLVGEDFARTVIQRAFEGDAAGQLMKSLHGPEEQHSLDYLNQLDPKVIAEFTKAEHPQTIALILAHLEPPVAGRVLSQLPEEIRSEVILRAARLKEVAPSILQEISQILQTEVMNLGDGGKEIGGPKKVADILNHTERSVETDIMKNVRQEDAELAEGIQQLMFVFDDLVKLTDRAVQELLREIDTKTLAKALRGAEEEVQEKILRNMSKRAAQILQEEVESLGPTRLSEVEEAQLEIIKVTLALRDEGRIDILTGEDDVFL